MKKILLLDDNFEIVLMLRTIVGELGYAVRSATDGKSALALLQRESIDLIISDLRMPGMDGWEFIKRAREDGYTGHVLILTAFPQMAEATRLRSLGVHRLLMKPIQIARFEEQLHELLDETPEDPASAAGPESPSTSQL